MTAWLALALALAPGALAQWRGRAMASHPAETVAERLFAHRREVAAVAFSAGALLVLFAGVHATWSLPLFVLALLAGSYPARKAVLQESWSFAGYAVHMLRFGTAGAGFFLLLAATPAIVGLLGPISAVPLALALVVWATGSRHIFLALVRARPLDRPDLESHLERVVAASRVAAPTLHRAGPRGGRMVNAFALPALPQSSVLFTDDMLDTFSPDEIAAVFAHEVAHLEHFDRKRLLLRGLALLALVGIGAFAVPYLASRLPAATAWMPAIWALAVAIALPLALATHRGHETQSDCRAVALCGDADALVRALVKLHVLAAMPRRFSADVERGSSHPSLARRIQAVRRAGGAPSVDLSAPVVLSGVEAGQFVVLEGDRAHWLAGAPAERAQEPEALRLAAARVESLAYSELADLHLEAGRDRVVLVARSVAGKKTLVRLRSDAAAAAQAALDVVDARLAPVPPGGALTAALGALTAAGLVFAALLGGHPFLVGPAAAVALWRTGPAPLATAGVVALAAAGLSALTATGTAPRPLSLLVLGLAGLVGLLMAAALWRRAPETHGRGATALLVVQSVTAAFAGLGLVAATALGPTLLRLHQAAAGPAASVALLGLATALALAARPLGRRLAAFPLLAALLVALVGSRPFAEHVVRDPLLAAADVLAQTSAAPLPLALHRFQGAAGDARLSPGGRSFAVRSWDDEEDVDEGAGPGFRAGATGAPTREIDAVELQFVDDERALLLVREADGGVELRLQHVVAARAPEWSIDVGALSMPSVVVGLAEGRWQLAGLDREAQQARVLSGSLDTGTSTEVRFTLPDGLASQVFVGPRGGLALRPRISPLAQSGGLLPLLSLLVQGGFGYHLETEIVLLTPGGPRSAGVTGLDLECPPPAFDRPLSCLVHEGERTMLWEIDPAAGRLAARGSLAGRYGGLQAEADRLLAYGPRLEPVLLRGRGGPLERLRVDAVGMPVLARGGRAFGVLGHEGADGTLAVFALP